MNIMTFGIFFAPVILMAMGVHWLPAAVGSFVTAVIVTVIADKCRKPTEEELENNAFLKARREKFAAEEEVN